MNNKEVLSNFLFLSIQFNSEQIVALSQQVGRYTFLQYGYESQNRR